MPLMDGYGIFYTGTASFKNPSPGRATAVQFYVNAQNRNAQNR